MRNSFQFSKSGFEIQGSGFNVIEPTDSVTGSTNFRTTGIFVVCMPSLNLSAYGENAKEATDRLVHDILDDFFENLLTLKPEQAKKALQSLRIK